MQRIIETDNRIQAITKFDSCMERFFNSSKTFLEELKKIPEIVEAHFTTGNYSVIIKLYARDNEHLMNLLNERIQEIPGVLNTETMISLDQSIKKEIPVGSAE